MKKIIILIIFVFISFQVNAWDGIDIKNRSPITIDVGNLVREGLMIEFYDFNDNDFHNAEVSLLEEYDTYTRLILFDLELNLEREFIMDK